MPKTDYTLPYWYNELNILMVIDKYIQSKGLKYWTKETNYQVAFFNKTNPRQTAFIMKNTNDEYTFTNKILAGPLSQQGLTESNPQDLGYAIEIFLKENKLDKCKIIFPYHISANHWGLGRLIIDKFKKEVSIEIFDPLNPNRVASDAVINSIKSKLAGYNVSTVNVVEKHGYQKQQFDGTSCGVITAENAKGLLDDDFSFCQKEYRTEAETKALRQTHLNEVHNNQDFQVWLTQGDVKLGERAKLRNEVWQAWEDLLKSVSGEEKGILFAKIKPVPHHQGVFNPESEKIETTNYQNIKDFLAKYKTSTVYTLLFHEDNGDIKFKNSDGPEQVYHLCRFISMPSTEVSAASLTKKVLLSNYSHKLTSGGLKDTIHGDMFQLALLTLVASRTARKNHKFYLITEAEEFEKFDDLVIDYGDRLTLLQAKHSADGGNYSAGDFCNSNGKDASLAKYFESWIKLQKSKLIKKSDGTEKEVSYVFFTNRGVLNADDLEVIRVPNDEFFNLNDKGIARFKKNDSRQKYIDAIKKSPIIKELTKDTPLTYDDIDWKSLQNIKQEAQNYLLSKGSKTLDHIKYSGLRIELPQLVINGTSKLTDKAIALIQLAVNQENVWDWLLEKKYTWNCINITTNFREPIVILATSKSLDNQINKFLDSFIIRVWQPNKDVLLEILQKEFGADEKIKIGAAEFYNSISQYMLQWFTARHECILKGSDFENTRQIVIADLNRFYLLGDTKRFTDDADKLYEKYKDFPSVEGVKTFLKTSNQTILCVLAGESAEYIVYNRIKNYIAQNRKDAEWFYISAMNEKQLSLAADILKGESTKFIIVDCRNLDDFVTLTNLAESANQYNKKLILLVNKNYYTIYEDLAFVFKSPSTAIRAIEKPDLSGEEIESLIGEKKDHFITLAGKQISFMQVLADKTLGLYKQFQTSVFTLTHLIDSSTEQKLKIATGMPEDVFVANDIIRGKPYYSLVTLLQDQSVISVTIAADQFKKATAVIEKNVQEEDRRKQLLNKINNSQRSLNPISISFTDEKSQNVLAESTNLRVLPEGYKFLDTDRTEQPDFLKLSDQKSLVIFSANAGYGKTSLAFSLRKEWMEGNLNYAWVIRVNLPKVDVQKISDNFTSVFDKSSTDFAWSDWQFMALKHDLQSGKRVLIIADGFDEIKNVEAQEKINQWLDTIPLNAGLVINTRPYAASKIIIPGGRELKSVFTFSEYTEEQKREYVEKFLVAITLKNSLNISEEANKILIEQIITKLKSSDKGAVIGIPLETYLFCMSLETKLINESLKPDSNFDDFLENQEVLNTLSLYQNFIQSKLSLFMQKHMKVSLETTLSHPHRVYSFSSVYTDLIAIFAFSQKFGDSSAQLQKRLDQLAYTSEMLEEINDSGLVIFENKESHPALSFLHATYQDYFAAIYVLRKTVMSENSNLITQIQERMYDPNFRILFMFASMITIQGDRVIANFNSDQQRESYWNKYFKDHVDVLGVARDDLLEFCLQEVDQSKLTHRPYIPKLPDKKHSQDSEDNIYADVDFVFKIPNQAHAISAFSDDEIRSKLKDRNQILKFVQEYCASGGERAKLVEILTSIIDKNEYDHGYFWGIDGGFKAMAYLGNDFNQIFKNFYLSRIKELNYNYGLQPSLKALLVLNKVANQNEFLYEILFEIIKVDYKLEENELRIVKHLISRNYERYWHFLQKVGSSDFELPEIKVKNLFDDAEVKNKLSKEIITVLAIFRSAYIAKSAVMVSTDYSSVTIDGTCRTTIEFKSKTHTEILKLIIHKVQEAPTESREDLVFSRPNAFIADQIVELFKFEAINYLALSKKLSEQIKEIVYDRDKVAKFFKIISQADLVHDYSKTLLEKTKDSSLVWSVDGGIEAVGYLAKAFNNDFAKFLIDKAEKNFQDSKIKAIAALKNLKKDLQSLDSNEANKQAIEAYNVCIQDEQFKDSGLEKIVYIETRVHQESQTDVTAFHVADSGSSYLRAVKHTESESNVCGPDGALGLPMQLKDLLVSAELFEIGVTHYLPQAGEGYKYLIIDSDNITENYNRNDIEIIYQDIQDHTASCGDNALITARKAKELGFESYIYVANGHAVALILYDQKLDHQSILKAITATELQDDASLWKKYVEVMTGNVLYLGDTKDAILQEFVRIIKDLNITEEELLELRIETLLAKINSKNFTALNDIKPVLQSLLEQINESKELKNALDTNNLDTLYNNLIIYITEFAETAAEATKILLQSLLFSVEAEFLNPLQSSPNYFPPYYPPGKPDDEPDYRGGSGFGGQNPNDNYGLMIAGNNTSANYSISE